MYTFEEALKEKSRKGGRDEKGWHVFIIPNLQEDMDLYFKANSHTIPKDEEAIKYSSDGFFGLYSRNLNK